MCMNRNIMCSGGECERCGWNPTVAAARVNALREKLRGAEPVIEAPVEEYFRYEIPWAKRA